MRKKKSQKPKKSSSIKRLLIANAIATVLLIAVSIAVLWGLGLLGSIFAFLFCRLERNAYAISRNGKGHPRRGRTFRNSIR
ncbi:MAG: hypothetical protein J6U87_00880 [Clostridia bacterium]|nr:hypothetical protein [Clostridia bacterium]